MSACSPPRYCSVGNLLGLHMPRTARKSGWLAVAIGGTFMAVCAVVLLATRDSIGRIFSNDAEVVAIIATIAPMGALFQVCAAGSPAQPRGGRPGALAGGRCAAVLSIARQPVQAPG